MPIFSDLELEGIMNEAKNTTDVNDATDTWDDLDGKDKKSARHNDFKTPDFSDDDDSILGNIRKNTSNMKSNFTGSIGRAKSRVKGANKKLKFRKKVNEAGEIEYELINDDAEYIEEKAKSNPLTSLKNRSAVEIEKQRQELTEHPGEKAGELAGSAFGAAGSAIAGPAGGAVAGFLGKTIGKNAGKVTDKSAKAIRKKVEDSRKEEKNRKLTEAFDFRDVYRFDEYTKAMNEFFDITDRETRKVLLSVNEADQSKVLVSLTAKLYDNVVDKVDDIDFGDIPATKGDLEKLPNLPTMIECLETMHSILLEFKQDPKPVETIVECINNIIHTKDIWTKAYAINVELPIITYNTMVLSCIEATSYLVSMCVEYIKKPSEDTMQIMIDKSGLTKSKQHMIFKNIESINDAFDKGQIEKAMNHVIQETSSKKNFVGSMTFTTIGVGASIVGITGILFCIIPVLRELIFLFYYYRVRVSEFFDLQADMLQINSYNVENNRLDLTKEERKSIATKQMKTAERFRKAANFFAVKYKNAEKEAVKEVKKESQKKYKADEVMDELPDSAASSSLF